MASEAVGGLGAGLLVLGGTACAVAGFPRRQAKTREKAAINQLSGASRISRVVSL